MSKPAEVSLFALLSKSHVVLPEEKVAVTFTFEEGSVDRVVILRSWTASERDAFEEDSLNRAQRKAGNGGAKRNQPLQADLKDFRARLVARTIVEDGERTFASADGEKLLTKQPAAVIDKLFGVAQRLHGMTDRDVENLMGNSESDSEETSAGDSSSSSREPSAGPSLN